MSGIALGALATFGASIYVQDGVPGRHTPAGETFAEIAVIEQSLAPNPGLGFQCADEHLVLIDACRTSPEPPIALWGDSYAMHLAPALLSSPTKLDFFQLTVSSCGPFPGMVIKVDDIYWKDCMTFNDDALNWIAKSDYIRTVILGSVYMPAQHDLYLRDGSMVARDAVHLKLVQSLLGTSHYLRQHGKTVVFVSPPPQNGISLGRCFISQRVMGLPPETCDFAQTNQTDRNREITAILRDVESETPVTWFDDVLCKDGICKTVLDTISVYRDSGHLSVQGSSILGRRVDLMGIVQQEASGAR